MILNTVWLPLILKSPITENFVSDRNFIGCIINKHENCEATMNLKNVFLYF